MDNKAAFQTAFDKAVASAGKTRQDLHMIPEVAHTEFKTAALCIERLVSFGVPAESIRRMDGTGIVVDVSGTGPAAEGPARIIALRADLDGLPIIELNDLPYKSTHEGRMHACGHDGHMATLLAVADVFLSPVVRSMVPSNRSIRLLFQPAEEAEGGAEPLIREGALVSVDEIYGLHNMPMFPVGDVRVKAGAMMAHVAEFDGKVVGKGGHGSQPQAVIDPIITVAHVITALQTVVSRSVSPKDAAVVTVTYVTGGTPGVHNVVPSTTEFGGTIRDFDPAVFDLIQTRMHTITRCTCEAMGAHAELDIRQLYPVVVNTAAEAATVERASAQLPGVRLSDADLPSMASEDFSYYTQVVPGAFFFLGTQDLSRAQGNGLLHTANYDFNNASIAVGLRVYLAILDDRLHLGGALIRLLQ
eukprot:c22115_g1_i1.p1 GENE.c22115_g1_i1~~c22115_g1_i1.p1  ORF type:complete len:416 (+),score=79.38 c22115_g1_i1:32-1279(+)